MSRPVYLCKRKPKTQAIIIDAKKEGSDIPITEINKINLSINVSLYNAEIIPKTSPNNKATPIEDNAKTKVSHKSVIKWQPQHHHQKQNYI